MNRLSLRERRLVAVLLLVAAIALIWYVLAAPLLDGFAARAEQRAELRAAYARDEQAIVQIPRLRRHAERQRSDRARFQFTATNGSATQAVFKEQLTGTVAAVGGELRSAQDLPPVPGRVRARIDCRVTLDQLDDLLVRLGNMRPLRVVETLTVAADESLQTGRLGRLDVRLEIAADTAAPAPR